MLSIRLDDLVEALNKDTDASQGSESFLVAHDQIKRQILDQIDFYSNTIVIEITDL